ncbi:MAG: replicative DNA helicase [Lachnospiraceae bacterium]|nr:replicative DNA helicase [Lachnospiraceae bacterium]
MEETVSRKGMPHNLEAERSVIGSMLLDKEAIGAVTGIITGEDFYDTTLGIYFDVLVEMNQQGLETDEVTVQERMRARHVPEAQCSAEYMLELMNCVPSSANTADYAAIVRDKSRLRKFIRMSDTLAGECYKDEDAVSDVFARAEEQMFKLFQEGQAVETMPISRIVVEALNNIEKAAKSNGQTTGIPTGFFDLDYRTAGLQPSDLILIAARPSMGKTAFALNLAENIAVRKHVATAIFSLEMSKVQLVNRILSLDSGVNLQKIRTGKLEDHDWEDMMLAARRVGEAPLYIDDTPSISVQEVRSKCRKLKLDHELQLVMIDYLQLMESKGTKRNESRQNEVSEISRSLKALARELNCPVIALSQLSRQPDAREDKRPVLSDLRESGAIEQDADVVMFLYRDEYYTKEKCKEPGITEVIIGKQRNGSTGTIKLAWIGEQTKFANLDNRGQN